MRFHVLGLGSIGSLLAHHLRLVLPAQHGVTLIHRTRQMAADARAKGYICIENGGVVTFSKGFDWEAFEANRSDEPASKVRPMSHANDAARARERRHEHVPLPEAIDTLFITAKAYSTLAAVQKLLPRLSGNSTIVLLQNGMGIYEQLVHDLFRDPKFRPQFILASNTHGAWLKGSQNVVHKGVGEIAFGIVPDPMGRKFEASLFDERTPAPQRKLDLDDITTGPNDPQFARYRSLRSTIAVLSSLQLLNTSWKPMYQVQWAMQKKLVVNAVINPLTAILGCRNGDIFHTHAARRVARRVCSEAADAYAAQILSETQTWLQEGRLDPKQDIALGRIPNTLRAEVLEREVHRVAGLTRGNISSMLSDIRWGKRTEIDYINGYLLGLGSRFRVAMPATAMLLNLVKMRCAIPLDQKL